MSPVYETRPRPEPPLCQFIMSRVVSVPRHKWTPLSRNSLTSIHDTNVTRDPRHFRVLPDLVYFRNVSPTERPSEGTKDKINWGEGPIV